MKLIRFGLLLLGCFEVVQIFRLSRDSKYLLVRFSVPFTRLLVCWNNTVAVQDVFPFFGEHEVHSKAALALSFMFLGILAAARLLGAAFLAQSGILL